MSKDRVSKHEIDWDDDSETIDDFLRASEEVDEEDDAYPDNLAEAISDAFNGVELVGSSDGIKKLPDNRNVTYKRDRAYTLDDIANPANISFPMTLPIEIALNEHPVNTICKSYGISLAQLELYLHNPVFKAAIKTARDMIAKEGVSFKLKAKLQAEGLLETSWGIIHDPRTPHSVRADLIKSTVRWAGHDTPDTSVSTGNGFAININFSQEPKKLKVVNDE